MRLTTRSISLALGALLTTTGALASAPMTYAAPVGGVTCHGGQARFSTKPGLGVGDRQQAFTVGGLTSGCTTTDPTNKVTAANIQWTGTGKGSCLPGFGIPNSEGTGLVRWSTPEGGVTSKVRGVGRLTSTNAVFEGAVTGGAHSGKRFSATAATNPAEIATVLLGCLTSGVTELSLTWDTVTVAEG
ncbi:hypothetical protein ACIBL5_13225 [Streptomyces sp. NPDC050516]|uniref:hypothetical protein n=1 Tax=Streptomyces sp. NPDC050516 TaxID=3365621 RepID=UPI00379C1C63